MLITISIVINIINFV